MTTDNWQEPTHPSKKNAIDEIDKMLKSPVDYFEMQDFLKTLLYIATELAKYNAVDSNGYCEFCNRENDHDPDCIWVLAGNLNIKRDN